MNEMIKGEINELAEIILEQTQKLLAYPDGAPQIEVDIIKENIRKLYDNVDALVDVNWTSSVRKVKAIDTQIDEQVDELLNIAEAEFQGNIDELSQQMGDLIDEQYEVKEEEIELSQEIVETIISETKEAEEPVEVSNNKSENKPAPKEQELPEKTAAVANATTDNQNLGDHLLKKPLKSLKTAIGINDKFQFINELFDGSMKIYNQAMDQIEESKDTSEAMQNFHSIASTGNWDEENPAYLQLLDYVERRFL